MKRHDLIYRNRLRPGIVMNIILLIVLLAVFCLCHAYLGVKQSQKAAEVKRLEDERAQLQNQILELNVKANAYLNPGWLAKQKDFLGLSLRHIRANEWVELARTAPPVPPQP